MIACIWQLLSSYEVFEEVVGFGIAVVPGQNSNDFLVVVYGGVVNMNVINVKNNLTLSCALIFLSLLMLIILLLIR